MSYFKTNKFRLVKNVVNPYAVDITDDFIVLTTAGSVTLPDNSLYPVGFQLSVKAVGPSSVSLNGQMRLNDAVYSSITSFSGHSFVNDGSRWVIF